jgi:hypothetical protein
MPDEAVIRALREQLFREGSTCVYALLDGASVEALRDMLWQHEPEHACLWRGELEPDMAEVAPYVVRLEAGTPFTDWLLARGWGRHWGIFALAGPETDLRDMRRHFREFTMVRGPDDEVLYFRYYDPRVLRVYLPLCNAEEMRTVFGPVRAFLVEDEDPAILLRFTMGEGQAQREQIRLDVHAASDGAS